MPRTNNTQRSGPDERANTTPEGLAFYAESFLEAATMCRGPDEDWGPMGPVSKRVVIPALYLLGHSIELSLKAFLLHRGLSLENLRLQVGHDLEEALRRAETHDLSLHVRLTSEQREALSHLNQLYRGKELEYIKTGPKVFPGLILINVVAECLVEAVCRLVGRQRWDPR